MFTLKFSKGETFTDVGVSHFLHFHTCIQPCFVIAHELSLHFCGCKVSRMADNLRIPWKFSHTGIKVYTVYAFIMKQLIVAFRVA